MSDSEEEFEKTSRPLSQELLQSVLRNHEDALEKEWCSLVQHDRLLLLEACCSPECVLTHTCQQKFGVNSAERVSHWNGGDIETKEGVNLIKNIVSEKRSAVDGVSPECGPYSPMQHLNMRTPETKGKPGLQAGQGQKAVRWCERNCETCS